MRYIISKSIDNEVSARREYLVETFNMWFTTECVNGVTVLKSFPEHVCPVCFIVGHNREISDYLKKHRIPENVIIIISCLKNLNLNKESMLGKEIYISNQNKYDLSNRYKGSAYGFKFDVTESEIILFNSRKCKDIIRRIKISFETLNLKNERLK